MKKFLFLLIAMVCAFSINAQTVTVRGTVNSEDGEPIVGASLMVEGTNIGTLSDIDGNFVLNNVPATAKYLRVSYVGMAPQTVAIKDNIHITLRVNSELLDEVVVTALGISRSERSLGYSATQVSGAEIEQAQTNNVMNALQGKVAGLQINNMSSAPGAANNVQIRGIGSVSGNNQPLYVVDGVPLQTQTLSGSGQNLALGGISSIAPDDIASLTVLKGAAATALYGSRAANGVIIVTTKNGSENKNGKNFQVIYSGNVEGSRVGYLPEMQNTYGQGWQGNQTYIENGSWGPMLNGTLQPFGPVYDGQQLVGVYSAVKNNVRDFFDTGWSQNHNVSLSGTSRDKSMTYYASYSYTGQDGVIPTDNDSFRRNTLSLRGSYQPLKWLKVSTNMNLATYRTKAVDQSQGTTVIDGLYELSRNVPTSYYKNLDNPFATPTAYYTPYGITNPYWALENNKLEVNGKQVYGKLQLELFPVKGLTLSYRFGFDYTDNDTKQAAAQVTVESTKMNQNYGYDYADQNAEGFVYTLYGRRYELNHDFLANYQNQFVDNRLDLNATIGFNINERGVTQMYGQSNNLGIESGFWDLSNGASWSSLGEGQSKRRLVGLFGDVTLGWDNFLYLDITARNDWSSTLPIGKNSFFYPGVTLSAVFTRWMKNTEILSFGKVRLAYGRTGSDASPYMTMTNFAQAYYPGYYVGTNLSFPLNSMNAFMASATAGAKTLRPEMTDEFEVGLNLKFFNGRIDIDASYYNRDTKDQIFTLPVDPASGYNNQVVNFGKVRNRGVELIANFIPVQTRDWQWTIGFNWSKNWNKVLSLPEGMGGKTGIYGFTAGSDNVTAYAEVGKPIGEFYTYLPSRVENEDSPYYGALIVDRYGQPVVNTGEGIKDTGLNMQYDWTGGVTTALTWKGLTLSASFDFRQGGYMFSRTKNLMQFTGNGVVTMYNNRFPFIIPGSVVASTSNGVTTYTPNTTPILMSDAGLQDYYDSGYGNAGLAYLVDRSFTKLRNLSLTWSLPYKWVKACCLEGIDITVYGNNLFLWTAKGNRYIDPETSTISASSYGDMATMFGELYSNPSNRTIGLNLKITL
ncbi:MAG: SusC/RagA family TonB-linked outer membrane protein [Muribaculaceae bacterium]|nr:SusC/RagA family TonB-linked outer membrane protein [Muribaculaceae bacterium]